MSAHQIERDTFDHEAGWPRPYYLGDDGRPRFVQYVGAVASEQIMQCSEDRTYAAGVRHACSCCGFVMQRGLLLDVWSQRGVEVPDRSTGAAADDVQRLDEYSGNFGSPLCYRCAVLALKHCPHYAAVDQTLGGDARWLVTSGAGDYAEFDETSALEVPDGVVLEQTTTADIREQVRLGMLHLTDTLITDLPELRRPADDPNVIP